MRGGVGIIGRTSGGDEVPLPSVAMTEKAVGSNVVVDRGIIMPLGGLALVSCSKLKVEVEEGAMGCSRTRRWLLISVSSMSESSMMMGKLSAFFSFPL